MMGHTDHSELNPKNQRVYNDTQNCKLFSWITKLKPHVTTSRMLSKKQPVLDGPPRKIWKR